MVPNSGQEKIVWLLLDQIEAKRDKIVVRRDSPFTGKFYRYSKELEGPLKPLFKRFYLLMWSTTVRMVEEREIQPLPASLVAMIPRKDVYLAELAATTADKTIVTTDARLKQSLDGNQGFRVHLAQEFLEWYLKGLLPNP